MIRIKGEFLCECYPTDSQWVENTLEFDGINQERFMVGKFVVDGDRCERCNQLISVVIDIHKEGECI
jgi:hypothetical protein